MRKVTPMLVACAMLAVSPAMAQQVYKCSDGKSAVVYQQVPCADTGQEQDVREYAREPTPDATQDVAAATPATDLSAASAATPRPQRTKHVPSPSQQRANEEFNAIKRKTQCDQARENRDKALASIGRSVTRIRNAEALVARLCR